MKYSSWKLASLENHLNQNTINNMKSNSYQGDNCGIKQLLHKKTNFNMEWRDWRVGMKNVVMLLPIKFSKLE
jgi:hypothetical protein